MSTELLEAWRICLIVVASLILGEIARVMWAYQKTGMTRTQFARFMALLLAVAQVIITEYQKLNRHLNWHVWVNTAMLGFAIYGCWGMAKAARHAQDREASANEPSS